MQHSHRWEHLFDQGAEGGPEPILLGWWLKLKSRHDPRHLRRGEFCVEKSNQVLNDSLIDDALAGERQQA